MFFVFSTIIINRVLFLLTVNQYVVLTLSVVCHETNLSTQISKRKDGGHSNVKFEFT